MLVMSQDTWFPNQDKTAFILFFFFPLGKVFFSLFFVSFYPRSVDLIRTVLYTLAYTAAIVLYSRAKCWHCKMY